MAFDPQRLTADFARIVPDDWSPHFNTAYYEGDWSGIALRTTEGAHVPLFPNPSVDRYVETPFLDRCPYFRELLAAFLCPLKTARLLRLKAGSRILEHRDYDLGFEVGELRVHVPVQTNPAVQFFLDGTQVVMREGEAWYLDLSLPHRVENQGATDRIHLVIDCVLNDWMKSKLGVAHAPIDYPR
jgi:hypothetical protein